MQAEFIRTEASARRLPRARSSTLVSRGPGRIDLGMSLTPKGPQGSRCVAIIHDAWAPSFWETSIFPGRCMGVGRGVWHGQVGMVEV